MSSTHPHLKTSSIFLMLWQTVGKQWSWYFIGPSHQEMESISPPLEAGHGHETSFGHWHVNKCDSRNGCTGAYALLLFEEYRHSVKLRTVYWMLETCIQTCTSSPETISDIDHPAPSLFASCLQPWLSQARWENHSAEHSPNCQSPEA